MSHPASVSPSSWLPLDEQGGRVRGCRVGVARSAGVHRVIAIEPIEPESLILEVSGVFVDHPSRYSIQVGECLHVEPPRGDGPEPEPDRYPWRYLNHSCDPNAAMAGLKLIAVRRIGQWEEITFDYNTSEYEMAAPFACECRKCGGSMVRGYKFLPADRQRELYPRLAEHLRRRVSLHGTG